ncbi:MAG: malate dehydrogenase, partial [Gammaproteobacteria bacterium]|nr:malate dehydrogenase [Gammaproteobacteria bacterium]
MKLSIIGSGSVGGQAAFASAERGFASSIVLLDTCAQLAQAKALDIQHAMVMQGVTSSIVGTDDWQCTAHSDVIVITAGFARRPGMKRRDLLSVNAEIVRNVAIEAARYSPDSILIVVTNPVNSMSMLVQQVTRFPSQRVIGMGGVLDNA